MLIIAGCDTVDTILTHNLVSNSFFLRKQSHITINNIIGINLNK